MMNVLNKKKKDGDERGLAKGNTMRGRVVEVVVVAAASNENDSKSKSCQNGW